MKHNIDYQSEKVIMLDRLKNFIQDQMPDYIRKEGNEWVFDAFGAVWYDAFGSRETFDTALMGMLDQYENMKKQAPSLVKKKERGAELINQQLKIELENARLEILKLKNET
jgi:hypothetical protein